MKEHRYKKYMERLREGSQLNCKEQLILILQLSFPAIIAQIASVIMGYIDASMVGQLGSYQAASIGLVSTSTWLLGSIVYASVAGFTVQVAQAVGAKKDEEAKHILKQSIGIIFLITLILLVIGAAVSGGLPVWLGGTDEVAKDASMYFMVYSLGIPAMGMNALAGGMLQSSGNMKIPGILNSAMCLLDVIFNFVLIFPTAEYAVLGMKVIIPGMNLGVMGAALGTAFAEVVTAVIMMGFLLFHSTLQLDLKKKNIRADGAAHTAQMIEQQNRNRLHLKKAFVIAAPVAFEHFVVCLAMIVTTKIIAPLGVAAIAANSFAITAESLCYMPGYGIAEAASTLVGQSIGASQKHMARQFARRTAYLGAVVTLAGSVLMYVSAPAMIGILTHDSEVLELGIKILRIEAFAEPFYVCSIIISGALRGAGDTLVPSIMNFISLWFVRIPLSYLLAVNYALTGVWVAMCLELIFRGSIFFIRLWKERWLKAV